MRGAKWDGFRQSPCWPWSSSSLAALPASASASWVPGLSPGARIGVSRPERQLAPSTDPGSVHDLHAQRARSQEHLSALSVSRQLRASANRKAHDIKRCGQFSHYACGRNPFYWEQRVGFFRGSYGALENLALTFGPGTTVRGAMDLWLNSPEHRRNLLAPQYRNVGTGR